MNVHCEVLVVGAGPAGLAAALTAARSGVRVVLLDDQPEAGGSLLGTAERIDGRPALEWVAAAVAELATFPEVRVLQRTTAFGFYDDGFVLALERRTDHLGLAAPAHLSRQRVWRLRARQVVVATGAHERPVVFADNDRPGIMLAASARTYLHRYGVLCGRRAVVFTTNDSAYAAAVDLSDAGVEVAAVVDARAQAPARWAGECERRGIEVRAGQVVTGTSGSVARHPGARRRAGRRPARGRAPASAATCSWSRVAGTPPCTSTARPAAGCRYDDSIGAFLPGTDVDGVGVAGSARGRFTLGECLRDGAAVARSALTACGLDVPEPATPVTEDAEAGPSLTLWSVPDPAEQDCGSTQFVDLQRDASVTDILRATGAGLRSVEHVKRYTTIGTAHDQGKTSGIISSGIVADALGVRIADLGTTTFRPPYTPVSFAALAGRDRGHLHDPSGSRRCTSGTSARRQVRGRRAVEAALVLPAPGRGPAGRRAAGVPGRPAVGGDDGRLHPRQDRGGGRGRGPAARPRLHQPHQHPEGRRDPLRRHVRGRRHGRSTTAR